MVNVKKSICVIGKLQLIILAQKRIHDMYYNAYFCIKCDNELTWKQRMYSYGRCPYCGYKEPSAGTIVSCYERGYKWVRNNVPWYKFWKSHYSKQFIREK